MYVDEFTPLRDFISRFIDMTDSDWRVHQQLLSRRSIRKGEYLLRAGQPNNHVAFVNQGCFRSYSIVRDQEITNFFIFEGEYAADYDNFLLRKPAAENLQALEDAEVILLHYDDMQTLYEKIPAWQKFGRLMAEYLFIHISQRARDLQYHSPEDLYLRMIKNSPHVLERVPQQYIASYLGIQPESLSRIRKRVMVEKRV